MPNMLDYERLRQQVAELTLENTKLKIALLVAADPKLSREKVSIWKKIWRHK
jgi:hypothetical protein